MSIVHLSAGIAAVLLSLCTVRAESSVTQLTKDLTEDPLFSFAVDAEPRMHNGKHDCIHMRITVTPKDPKKRIPGGRFTGQLEIFNGSNFVSSCALQPAKLGENRFAFTLSISSDLVKKSRFTFSEAPLGENPTAQGFFYWFFIGDLLENVEEPGDEQAEQGGARRSASPSGSSNEALMRAMNALRERDTDALLSTVLGGSKAQEFFVSVIDLFETMDAFKERFVNVYGEEAWATFQAPLPNDQKRPDMNLAIPDLDEIRKESSTWEANDTNRGVFDALPGVSLPYKKVEGGWVIDGASVFPEEETLIGSTETQKKLTEFIESYMKAIGQEGVSAEDMDYQMGKDLMIVLIGREFNVGGESPYPDRFKIDEL